jgi:hypothetical protein
MRTIRPLILSTVLLMSASFIGCGAETAFDCDAVCTRYRDCYDSGYDVGKCRDNCRARAANDSTVQAKADACETCIGGMSCLSATFNCAQDCMAIVP